MLLVLIPFKNRVKGMAIELRNKIVQPLPQFDLAWFQKNDYEQGFSILFNDRRTYGVYAYTRKILNC